MQNYKISVSKNQKKFTIFLKAEAEALARERVHKEWYSILSIEQVTEKNNIWNVFLFSWYNKNWELKNGKIVWDDIFKTYIKLRKSLEYNVLSLYSEKDKDISQAEKDKIINDLKEEFLLLYKNKRSDTENIKNDLKKEKEEYYLKKELDEINKLILFILEKLNKIQTEEINLSLDYSKKEKIKELYNSIIKLKKSTNISKLKEVWEKALEKIWELELAELEKNKSEKVKELLKETNILLKKIWSKQSFIEKDKDISYIINSFFERLNNYFLEIKENKKRSKKQVDKNSHSYIKNLLFLKKYKEKLKLNTYYILKNIVKIALNKEERDNVLLRRKVIKQNITLFKAKEKGVWFSYTYINKWITKIIEIILKFLVNLKYYIFTIIIIFIIMCIITFNINYYFDFQEIWYLWIFSFLVLIIVYCILNIWKNLFLIIFNFVILFFIVIFWVVNF